MFPDRVRLRQILTKHFSLEEIRTLCFDLGVDFDALDGREKEGKARELVSVMERRQRLPDLEAALASYYEAPINNKLSDQPKVETPKISKKSSLTTPPIRRRIDNPTTKIRKKVTPLAKNLVKPKSSEAENSVSTNIGKNKTSINIEADNQASILLQKIQKLLEQMKAAEQYGNWDRAIELGEQVLGLDSKHHVSKRLAEIYVLRAELSEEVDAYLEAANDYTEAIKIEPKRERFFGRGLIYYYWLETYFEAARDFEQCIELYGGDAATSSLLALSLVKLKKYQQALAISNQFIPLYPDEEDLYLARGLIYKAVSNYSKAIEDLKKAISLGSDEAEEELDTIPKWAREIFDNDDDEDE